MLWSRSLTAFSQVVPASAGNPCVACEGLLTEGLAYLFTKVWESHSLLAASMQVRTWSISVRGPESWAFFLLPKPLMNSLFPSLNSVSYPARCQTGADVLGPQLNLLSAAGGIELWTPSWAFLPYKYCCYQIRSTTDSSEVAPLAAPAPGILS